MNTIRTIITIDQLEDAINRWRTRFPTPDDGQCPTLCREARLLADIYGLMIYRHQREIDLARFTPAQLNAFWDAANARFA